MQSLDADAQVLRRAIEDRDAQLAGLGQQLEAAGAREREQQAEQAAKQKEVQRLMAELAEEASLRQAAEGALAAAQDAARRLATAERLATPSKVECEADADGVATPQGDVAPSPATGHTPAAMKELKNAFSQLRRQTEETEKAKAVAADAGAACEWLGEQLAQTEQQVERLTQRLRQAEHAQESTGGVEVQEHEQMLAKAVTQWADATETELHKEEASPQAEALPLPQPIRPEHSGGFDISPIQPSDKSAGMGKMDISSSSEESFRGRQPLSMAGVRGGSVAAQFRARRRTSAWRR